MFIRSFSGLANLAPASAGFDPMGLIRIQSPAASANLNPPVPNPIPLGYFLQYHALSPQAWAAQEAKYGYPDYGWDIEANVDGSMNITLTPPTVGNTTGFGGFPGPAVQLNLPVIQRYVSTEALDQYSIGIPWIVSGAGLVPGAPKTQLALPTVNKNFPFVMGGNDNPENFVIYQAWLYSPYTAPVRNAINQGIDISNTFIEKYVQQQNSKGFFNHFNNFMKKAIPIATEAMFAYAGGVAVAQAAAGTAAASTVNTMEAAAHSVYGEALSAAHDVSQVVGALKNSVSTGIAKIASDVVPKSLQSDVLNYVKNGAVSKAVSSLTQFAVKAYDQNRINKAQQQAALQAAASIGVNPPSPDQTTFQGAVSQSVTKTSGMPSWLGPAALVGVTVLAKIL